MYFYIHVLLGQTQVPEFGPVHPLLTFQTLWSIAVAVGCKTFTWLSA